MSLLVGAFLVGIAAGLYIGLLLAQLLRLPPDEHETMVIVASGPINDRPGCAVCERFTRARMLKHGIFERSRN